MWSIRKINTIRYKSFLRLLYYFRRLVTRIRALHRGVWEIGDVKYKMHAFIQKTSIWGDLIYLKQYECLSPFNKFIVRPIWFIPNYYQAQAQWNNVVLARREMVHKLNFVGLLVAGASKEWKSFHVKWHCSSNGNYWSRWWDVLRVNA